MLKKFAIIVAVIVFLPFVIALFVQTDYEVERNVEINKSKADVFDYVKYLKNQDNFSKWAQIDPEMTKSYRGTDGTVGFVSAWDSKHEDVGVGEQEIMAIVDGQRIDYQLRFLKPFESTSPAYMLFEAPSTDKTVVKWGFKGEMAYPMNIMFLFMDFEKVIGDDLQLGLDNLKVILEES